MTRFNYAFAITLSLLALTLVILTGATRDLKTSSLQAAANEEVLLQLTAVEIGTNAHCVPNPSWSNSIACTDERFASLTFATRVQVTKLTVVLTKTATAGWQCDFTPTDPAGTILTGAIKLSTGTTETRLDVNTQIQNFIVELGEAIEIKTDASGCAGVADPTYNITIHGRRI